MLRMLKNTKLQKHALSALKLPRVYLTALLALSLSACGNAPQFPTDRIWETSIKDGVCGEYQVIDTQALKVRHVKDWPLSKCDGVFGFSTKDAPQVLRWGEKTQAYVKQHCK